MAAALAGTGAGAAPPRNRPLSACPAARPLSPSLQAKTSATQPVGPNGVPLNQAPITPQAFNQPNFGPKYEQHIQQLQQSLEDAQKRIDDLQKLEASLRCGRQPGAWAGGAGGWRLALAHAGSAAACLAGTSAAGSW